MKGTTEFSTTVSIKALRVRRNLSQLELARRAGMSPAQLCKIERGQNGLTASTLRRLAEALDVSIAALMGEAEAGATGAAGDGRAQERRVPCGLAEFVPVLAAGEVGRSIVADVAKQERALLEVENSLGIVPQSTLRLIYAYGDDERAAEILARDVRVSLGLGSQPCVDLAPVLENAGVRIVQLRGPGVFQSASFYNVARRTLSIALNADNTAERNAYRLAYELGGAVVFASHGFKTVVDEGAAHRFLRAFAAAFLMPEEAVRGAVARLGVAPDGWTMPVLVWAKERFGVSAEAFALRLESLGLIAPAIRLALRDELRARYTTHLRSKEPHPPKNQSRLDILKAIEKGRKEHQ
ncbi:MAG: ImmA/IrrE family metallo-endopeptidase [Kiritimatiellae bacterium]|nr:ImmA/IrrE family metallo-endopeptidase [Kiritimatiellia bacterium]